MLAKSSVGISLSCRSYHAIFTLHQNIFNGVLVCLSFRYSTCRYKTLYVWLQLPISSFWAYSIRISTSILNEKVYSAHSTLLLHTFPYHLPLTSFTWFPCSILLHTYLVHFTFSYHGFIFLYSCHSALLHSPSHSLHSFPFCLSPRIFIELSSFTRWEFVKSNTSEWAGLAK